MTMKTLGTLLRMLVTGGAFVIGATMETTSAETMEKPPTAYGQGDDETILVVHLRAEAGQGHTWAQFRLSPPSSVNRQRRAGTGNVLTTGDAEPAQTRYVREALVPNLRSGVRASKEAIERAVAGTPRVEQVLAQKHAEHPFAANAA